jgi:RNA polymerase sigma-B factor
VTVSAVRQLELLRAVHSRHDARARGSLIEENLPLVRALAHRYAGRGEQLEDLVQVGTIGLIKAIDRFDPDRCVELQGYAIPMIVGEIKRHFRDRGWAVRVPRSLKELYLKLAALIDQMSSTLGRSPTIGELAEAAGVEVEEVVEALEAGHAYAALSLSVPVADDPELTLEYTLADPESVYAAADDRDFISHGLDSLDERERRIIALRFFGGLSQSVIAQEVGISQMQVSRLIRRSLEKMRRELSPG